MITLPGEVDGHRVRVGCDVADVEDVQNSLAAFGDRYLRKVFTTSEINDCQGRNRVHRLAARFAAKEAVIKAFAEPDMSFPWREIEVTRDGPLPLLRLSGTLAEPAQRQGWLSSSLSLSHADCHAMAVVLVVCSPSRVRVGAMTRRHDPAWVWMIGALGGALALAGAVLADYGTGPDGIGQAVRYTARWSFLFFWLSYAGGAMAILFGPAFAGLARRARALGLAFAAALQVHIGLVIWLGVVIGQIPLQGGILLFFLIALFCTYLLVLLSFGIGTGNLGPLWRPLLFLATTYILVAFGRDFLLDAPGQLTQHWLSFVEYVPFALLSLIAIPLRLAAFLRQRFESSPVSTKPAKRTLVDR